MQCSNADDRLMASSHEQYIFGTNHMGVQEWMETQYMETWW